MLREDSQHSAQCWFLTIPKFMAPTPPKFPLGLFVRLSDSYQHTPQVTYYGRIVGILWFEEYGEWSYSVEAPMFHRSYYDSDCLYESELEQRLAEDGWELSEVA